MLKTCFLLSLWNSALCQAEATNMTQEPKPKVKDNHTALGRNKMGACLTCSGSRREATGAAAEEAGRKGGNMIRGKKEGLTGESLAAIRGRFVFYSL